MLLHRPTTGGFDQKIQEAEIDYLIHSVAVQTSLAESYVGLILNAPSRRWDMRPKHAQLSRIILVGG